MSRFNLTSRLGVSGVVLAAIASSLSVSACSSAALCTNALPPGATGGSVNAAMQGSTVQGSTVQGDTSLGSTIPDSTVTMPGKVTMPGNTVPGRSSGQARTSGTAAQLRPDSVVTLPTGQQVRLVTAPDGGQSASPVLSGSATAYLHFSWGGDQYLIPDDAVPYLGTALDPGLFDVSYLARAQAASPRSATLPVDVTPAARGTSVPMTRATAVRLGQTLASSWDASRAASASTSLARAGLSRVTLAPPSSAVAPPAALPAPAGAGDDTGGNAGNLPRHTLTVNFTGADGKPGMGVGWVQNLDNARYGTFFVFPNITQSGSQLQLTGSSGPLRFSVPDGTYSLQFSILTPHAGTIFSTDAALVVKPDVTVNGDTSVTLDARTTVPYHATPAGTVKNNLQVDTLSYFRGSSTGGGCGTYQATLGLGLISVSGANIANGGAATQLSASPTGQVTEGTLGFVASTSIGDETSDGTSSWPDGPEYDMSFPYWGQIPQSLSFTVPAKDFTTLSQTLYADQNSDCPSSGRSVYAYAFQPWGDWQDIGGLATWNTTPTNWPVGTYTSYLYDGGSKLTAWQLQDQYSTQCSGQAAMDLLRETPLFTIQPGEKITQTWSQGPNVPSAAAVPLASPGFAVGFEGTGRVPVPVNPLLTVAPAVRQDDNGMLNLAPAGDSDPSHAGLGQDYAQGFANSTVEFYRDGKLAADGQLAASGGLDLPLLPTPASYRLDWTWANPVQLAATTTTSWLFKSAPGDPAAKLPATEQCAPDPSRACSLLPLLFLNYDLPLSLGDQAQAGTTIPFGITVSSQQGAAAPSSVTVTVAASFDDGKTWTTAQPAVSTGGGKFTASIDQPALSATDGFASLRVTATDGAGNSVTQTIIRAYGLTS
jgi:hypothetical protein